MTIEKYTREEIADDYLVGKFQIHIKQNPATAVAMISKIMAETPEEKAATGKQRFNMAFSRLSDICIFFHKIERDDAKALLNALPMEAKKQLATDLAVSLVQLSDRGYIGGLPHRDLIDNLIKEETGRDPKSIARVRPRKTRRPTRPPQFPDRGQSTQAVANRALRKVRGIDRI